MNAFLLAENNDLFEIKLISYWSLTETAEQMVLAPSEVMGMMSSAPLSKPEICK